MSIITDSGHNKTKHMIISSQHLVIDNDIDSDDGCSSEACSNSSLEENGLECPLCCEGFNSVHHVPYVLWCGHSVCKRCLLDLQWATVRFVVTPMQLPLFISCPWCQFLSCRLLWKGKLKYPSKNFFLLWLVENIKSDNVKRDIVKADVSTRNSGKEEDKGAMSIQYHYQHQHHHQQNYNGFAQQTSLYNGFSSSLSSSLVLPLLPESRSHMFFLQGLLTKIAGFCVQLVAKFVLILLALFLLFCVLPFSSIVLVLYLGATLFFAFPSFLVVYFAFPSLNWLLREIIT